MISFWLRLLEFIASITLWALESTAGDLQWHQGCWCPQQLFQVQQLGTRASSGGSWSQWCAYTWLWGSAASAYVVAGASCRHTCNGRGQGWLWAYGNCGGPDCWHALLWLPMLTPGVHTAVEASDRSQTGGMQVHSWKCWLQVSTVVPARDRRQGLIWSHSSCGALAFCMLACGCTCSPWACAL